MPERFNTFGIALFLRKRGVLLLLNMSTDQAFRNSDLYSLMHHKLNWPFCNSAWTGYLETVQFWAQIIMCKISVFNDSGQSIQWNIPQLLKHLLFQCHQQQLNKRIGVKKDYQYLCISGARKCHSTRYISNRLLIRLQPYSSEVATSY